MIPDPQQPDERRMMLLQMLYDKTNGGGTDWIVLVSSDLRMTESELTNTVRYLDNAGFLEAQYMDGPPAIRLTIAGIDKVEGSSRSPARVNNRPDSSNNRAGNTYIIGSSIGSFQQDGIGNTANVPQVVNSTSAPTIVDARSGAKFGQHIIPHQVAALNEIAALAEPLLRNVVQYVTTGDKFEPAYDSIQAYASKVRSSAHLIRKAVADELRQYAAELQDVLVIDESKRSENSLKRLRIRYEHVVELIRNELGIQ